MMTAKKVFILIHICAIVTCASIVSAIHQKNEGACFASSSSSGRYKTPSCMEKTSLKQAVYPTVCQKQPHYGRDRICTRATNEDEILYEEEEEEEESTTPKKEIAVSASIELPFPSSVAFDAFSDLTRQPSWSPMIRSVEYIESELTIDDDTPVTEWTMGLKGFKFSWKSISTVLERPYRIEWESISGLKNFGKIHFLDLHDDAGCHTKTRMTMSMTFFAPRVVSAMFRRSNKLANYVENKMILATLVRFRDIVLEEDLKLISSSSSSSRLGTETSAN